MDGLDPGVIQNATLVRPDLCPEERGHALASREGFHVAAEAASWPGKMLGDPVGLTPATYLMVMHVQEGHGHLRLVNLPDEERWLVRPLRLDAEKSQLPRDHGTDLGWPQARAGLPLRGGCVKP